MKPYVYTINPDGKFHMARNLFSFSPSYLVLWSEHVSPPESHIGILRLHVMVKEVGDSLGGNS